MSEEREAQLIKRHWAKVNLDSILEEMVFHRVHFDMLVYEPQDVMDLTTEDLQGSAPL